MTLDARLTQFIPFLFIAFGMIILGLTMIFGLVFLGLALLLINLVGAIYVVRKRLDWKCKVAIIFLFLVALIILF